MLAMGLLVGAWGWVPALFPENLGTARVSDKPGTDGIQRNLEHFPAYYHVERSHQGYRLNGRTPAEALARRATSSNYLSWVGSLPDLYNHGAKPMKSFLFLTAALGLVSLLGCGQDTPSSHSTQQSESVTRLPLEVVNLRMSAYNRHDLRSFLDTYSDGVKIFNYPDRSLGKGKKHIRSIFEPMFEEGVVQVTIHHQIAKDSYVVNHETVSNGDTTTEYVSIYEVRNGLIQSVGFVRD